jgi:hypothetical protein
MYAGSRIERRASNFLNGIKIEDVPGVTVNRYCASGLETIGMATAKFNQEWHIVCRWCRKHELHPMGGYKPTQIMLLQKQETKTTIGEWD